MKQGSEGPRGGGRLWQSAVRTSAVGLEMGLAVLVGYLCGDWLDGELGTGPYLMIVFLLLGWLAGLRGLYRAARRVMREQEENEE